MINLVQPESVGVSSERLQRIKTIMQGYVERGEFAGTLTLVARRGRVVHLECTGWADMEAQKPIEPDTIFRIYSMTKIITSVAAMMLVEEGKLRLVDPVSRYIPAFKDIKVMMSLGGGGDYELVSPKREPTVHDLFTHTAGLSYGFVDLSSLDRLYNRDVWKSPETAPGRTLEQFVQDIARLPLAFHPGTAFRYSVATDVLGYLVQLTSGKPFEDFLQDHIFEPLGMVDTGFWAALDKAHRLAGVYGPKEGGGLKLLDPPAGGRFAKPTSLPSGGGGLVCTAEDYFRFGQMLLNQGEFNGVRLLGRKTVEWMLQNHLPEGLHPFDNPAEGFGLGGSVLLHPGLSHQIGSPGCFGWGGAANTRFWIDPAEELLCLLMTQFMPAWALPIVEDFGMAVYQALI